jgi:hypothetical protein
VDLYIWAGAVLGLAEEEGDDKPGALVEENIVKHKDQGDG